MTVLTTDRLTLRPPQASDEAEFMAYTSSARYIAERGEQPLHQQWGYFAGLMGHWAVRGYGRFLVARRDTGAIIGHLGPLYPTGWPEREIAWHLWSDEAEGQGFAFEAAQAAVRHAFTDLGWDTAVSYIAPGNARSRALAERLGATVDPEATPLPIAPDGLVYRHPTPEGRA